MFLKNSAKRAGVPWSLVCDPHLSQTSDDEDLDHSNGKDSVSVAKRFLVEIGTTLRELERGTKWANFQNIASAYLSGSLVYGRIVCERFSNIQMHL